jgi:phosphatidylinositol phospholipase C delta
MEALDNQIAPGTLPQNLQPPQSKLIPTRSSMADVAVPEVLQHGVSMTKVSAKRQKTFVFRLDPDQGQILWESKKPKLSM